MFNNVMATESSSDTMGIVFSKSIKMLKEE